MQKSKNAFTMIELIFVIVILGILATVALPRFASTKEQADIASGRADVATIRSAIVNERQTQLVRGINTWIPKLSANDITLFTGDGDGRTLLMYGIRSGTGSGDWAVVANTDRKQYTYTVDGTPTTFDYNSTTGIFNCATGTGNCNALVD
ncbi:MAG: type II secretion system GspH family protein [Sulfurimonas sp.]|uniref:type II secretion system protein n=1 Tax=Sulfurimonas sp. TaxID=2022749 RepID=UPI0025F4A62E|nr:type II secretion system protein [Sulfurimonas sp.]MCK9491292.1 type II secretion system GspH family protein [Sulfurimonas sp.]